MVSGLRLWRRAIAISLGVVATAALVSVQALAEEPTRSCGWLLVGAGSQVNVLFPDEAAMYWTSTMPIPPGGHVEVHGQFPHARYTSLTTYTSQYQSIDGLHDKQIQPDPGSVNPFVAGANRNATKRDYTIRIVNDRLPAEGREANTIYTTSADGSKTGGPALQRFWLRIYEGDKGLGRTGGVPLPEITLVTADGQRITLPQCPDVMVPDLGQTDLLANAGIGEPWPVDTWLGGTNPPVWHKFTNFVSSVLTINGLDGSTTDELLPDGGFGDNPDNKYIYTTFTQDHGQVLAFRAKAPSFPRTWNGEPRMGTGQVRYWSLCTNAQTTAYYGCKQDDQVPVDRHGYYTIVVSTAAARPRNANEACGVAWVPAGPIPQSILIFRNMLPAPSFAHAIQKTEPATEAETMAEYYPRGTYYATTEDYERLGCPPAEETP